MPTIGDVITSAFTEIRVARGGDVLEPANMALGLYVLNRLLDRWNAEDRAVFCETFTDFAFTPNLSPHTIGPGGSFAVPARPVSVEFASVNLGSNVFRPIRVRDRQWYANQPTPTLTNTFPTDVYYEPNWPLGKLWFWGIPTTAYGCRLWMRVQLASVAQTDDFSFPQGYQAAIELTLAEELAPSCGQSVAPSTERRAREARAAIFGNNTETPRLRTQDSGIPTSGAPANTFNWRTRSFV